MVKIFGECNITEILFDTEYARCPTCNLKLEEKRERRDRRNKEYDPSKIVSRVFSFLSMCRCMKIYWEGSHKSALVSLAESVTQELQDMS